MFDYVWVALLVPIVSIITVGAVFIFGLERFYRVRKLDQETKLRAIEKGYDVPVHRPKPRYPFSWPFVLLGFGLSLILIYAFMPHADGEALGFGLVIFFIGAGLFASRFYGVKRAEQDDQLMQARTWRAPAGPTPATEGPSDESDFTPPREG